MNSSASLGVREIVESGVAASRHQQPKVNSTRRSRHSPIALSSPANQMVAKMLDLPVLTGDTAKFLGAR
jgi:hypothetical protein